MCGIIILPSITCILLYAVSLYCIVSCYTISGDFPSYYDVIFYSLRIALFNWTDPSLMNLSPQNIINWMCSARSTRNVLANLPVVCLPADSQHPEQTSLSSDDSDWCPGPAAVPNHHPAPTLGYSSAGHYTAANPVSTADEMHRGSVREQSTECLFSSNKISLKCGGCCDLISVWPV